MSLFCRTLLLALLGSSLSGCVVYEYDHYPRHGYYYGWGYPAPYYHRRYYYDGGGGGGGGGGGPSHCPPGQAKKGRC